MHQPIQRTRWHYVMKTLKRSKRVPAQARVTAQCRRSGCTNVRGSKRACCTRSPCSCSYCISRSCLHELQLQRYSWRKVCPTIAELAVSKKNVPKTIACSTAAYNRNCRNNCIMPVCIQTGSHACCVGSTIQYASGIKAYSVFRASSSDSFTPGTT